MGRSEMYFLFIKTRKGSAEICLSPFLILLPPVLFLLRMPVKCRVVIYLLNCARLMWPLTRSSVPRILQARIMSFYSLLQGIFPTQASNLGLLHCRQIFTIWATREALERTRERALDKQLASVNVNRITFSEGCSKENNSSSECNRMCVARPQVQA